MSRVERNNNVLRLATLFTGIDAVGHGASRVYDRVEHVFACEIDKFARKSFLANNIINRKHFHKDVKKLDATPYRGLVDILAGGSPCQSFSIAGHRKGTTDYRGGLIYEYIRVVGEVKAPVIIYENVKGILSIDNGRTIKEFIKALRELGYHCHYEVLNSKHYGVPQNRERFFLVGFLDATAYHAFSFAPKQPLSKQLKDILEKNVDRKYFLSEKMIAGFRRHRQNHKIKGNGFGFSLKDTSGVANTIANPSLNRQSDNYIKIAGSLNRKGHEYVNRVYDIDGLAPTLPTMQGGGQEPKIVAMRGRNPNNPFVLMQRPRGFNKGGKKAIDGVAPTLSSNSWQDNNHLILDHEIRKLTPRECLRLQGFDDSFKQVVSDSQMYKQAGNSMTATVLEMIVERVQMALSGVSESGTLMDFL